MESAGLTPTVRQRRELSPNDPTVYGTRQHQKHTHTRQIRQPQLQKPCQQPNFHQTRYWAKHQAQDHHQQAETHQHDADLHQHGSQEPSLQTVGSNISSLNSPRNTSNTTRQSRKPAMPEDTPRSASLFLVYNVMELRTARYRNQTGIRTLPEQMTISISPPQKRPSPKIQKKTTAKHPPSAKVSRIAVPPGSKNSTLKMLYGTSIIGK